MNDAEFKGYVKRALEDNDIAHKALFEKLKHIDDKLTTLRIKSVKGGFLGGLVTTAGIALLWILRKLY